MKTLNLICLCVLFSFGGAFAQNNYDELPQNTREFIEANFPSEKVRKAEKDKDLLDLDNDELYEVVLENGVKMDFNKSGNLTEIKSKDGAVIPKGVLPNKIHSYVEKNYPGKHIESWELDNNDQEVELRDGTDLEFDLDGNFVRVD